MSAQSLVGLMLSCALAFSQIAFAQNETKLAQFHQDVQNLTVQQKILLLDKLVGQINAQYAQRPSNEIIKSYDISHNAPHSHALTYTYHLQPILRQQPEWQNGQIIQYFQTYLAQQKLCFPKSIANVMNDLNIDQIRIVLKMENEIAFEKTQNLPLCR